MLDVVYLALNVEIRIIFQQHVNGYQVTTLRGKHQCSTTILSHGTTMNPFHTITKQ